jgi:ribosome biogenesis GTPase
VGLESLGWCSFFAEQARHLPKWLTIARIAAEHRGRYELWAEQGEVMGRRAGRLRHRAREAFDDKLARAIPAVGDWVGVRWPKGDGLAQVEHVFKRKTVFLRKAAGDRSVPQVLAANVDTMFVVVGLDGDFNVRRIERYLTQLGESGSAVVLVLNKADLVDEPEKDVALLREGGVFQPIYVASATEAEGVDALWALCRPGQTVAFVGSSGVGKSTLINTLLGEQVQKVGEVRESDDRGRHTTTHRQMLRLQDGGLLIDTPGIREVALWGSAAGIDEAFDDVLEVAVRCYFRDCRHQGEPECAVAEALEKGELDPERFEHYLALLAEQERQADRGEEFVRRESARARTRRLRAREEKKLED